MWHWLINIVTAWLIFSLARYRTKLIDVVSQIANYRNVPHSVNSLSYRIAL